MNEKEEQLRNSWSSQNMGGWPYTKTIQIISALIHLAEKVPQWEQMISKFLTASIYHREWSEGEKEKESTIAREEG